MLFILTGEKRSGKTRWLNRLIKQLAKADVTCHGLLTPGIWQKQVDESGTAGYEKLGIDAVLLPEGIRYLFALPRDLIEHKSQFDENWQSVQANLNWVITDEMLNRVNSFFDELAVSSSSHLSDKCGFKKPGFLIIDELGPLELIRNGGLTSAVKALEQGPTQRYQHALIVVRKGLLDIALDRFSKPWGEPSVITADNKSRALVLNLFR